MRWFWGLKQVSPWWLGFPTLWGTGQVSLLRKHQIVCTQLLCDVTLQTEATGRVTSSQDDITTCILLSDHHLPMYHAC